MRSKFSALRLLVIEDQADSRALLKSILMDLGISQVYEAADGESGFRFAGRAPGLIDIILCDWNMPSMAGIDLLRRIREQNASIPFLMITGRADEKSMMEAKSAGVSGFIRKPYTPAQVEAKLRILAERINAG